MWYALHIAHGDMQPQRLYCIVVYNFHAICDQGRKEIFWRSENRFAIVVSLRPLNARILNKIVLTTPFGRLSCLMHCIIAFVAVVETLVVILRIFLISFRCVDFFANDFYSVVSKRKLKNNEKTLFSSVICRKPAAFGISIYIKLKYS